MLVSSPVAIRSSTSTVGTLLPRSTSESIDRLTPVRASSAWSERRRRRRSPRSRAPSPAMSSPDDSRPFPSPGRDSTIEDIILHGGIRGACEGREKRIGGSDVRSPRVLRSFDRAVYCSGEVPTQPDSDTSTVTPSGALYFTSTLAWRSPYCPTPEGLVDVVAGRRPGGLQPLGDRFQALDLEADVVDAAPALAALDAGDGVVLEVEDGEVDVAVAQVVAPRAPGRRSSRSPSCRTRRCRTWRSRPRPGSRGRCA